MKRSELDTIIKNAALESAKYCHEYFNNSDFFKPDMSNADFVVALMNLNRIFTMDVISRVLAETMNLDD